MKINSFDRYGLIEMALKETGLAVVESVKQGKKTVITVACEQSYKDIEFPIKKQVSGYTDFELKSV